MMAISKRLACTPPFFCQVRTENGLTQNGSGITGHRDLNTTMISSR
jgi:hypothetical protein